MFQLFVADLSDKMTFPNVTEVKQNMNTGATLVRNDETGGFLVITGFQTVKCAHFSEDCDWWVLLPTQGK